MKNLLLLLLFTLSFHSLRAQVCTGNVAIENLANGMDYTITVGTTGAVDVIVTVVDNPVGLVGFLGGPGNPIGFPDGSGTFTYNLTGQAAPYVLDMFFNWTAGGAGNSETVSCPEAPAAPSLPITFEDGVIDYNLNAFDGAIAAIIPDPTDPTNTVLSVIKPVGAQCWAGVTVGAAGLDSSIPFAGNRLKMTVDIYSAAIGVNYMIKVENSGNGGIQSEVSATTTVANAWETLTFDLANSATAPIDLNQTYDKVSVFPNFNPCDAPFTNDPFYFDNIEILPAPPAPSLPITFDDPSIDYNLRGFDGAIPAIAADPADPTNSVLSITKPVGAQCWAGVVVADAALESPIPFAGNRLKMTVDVYSPGVGINMMLKVENTASPGGINAEVVATTTVANEWETLTFDFTNSATQPIDLDLIYDRVVLFPNFSPCDAPFTDDPFYFDNIEILPAFGPIPVKPSLPISFDDSNTIYSLRGFDGADATIVADPTDPDNDVLSVTKPAGSQCWAGVVIGDLGFENAIPFAAGQLEMRVDVYSPGVGINMMLKVENSDIGGIQAEVVATTTVANEWETLIFDLTNSATAPIDLNQIYDKAVVFPNFNPCSAPFTNDPFYFDNIRMTTQPYLECRQPTSTVTTPGMCMAEDIVVLDPFMFNPDMVPGTSVLTNNYNSNDYPIGTTVVQYTLSNENGSSSVCEQEVIIEDGEAPVVSGPSTIIADIDANTCMATVPVDFTVTDNCGEVASVSGLGTFSMGTGIYEHPITTTDLNGNTAVTYVTIEVHDPFGPEFNNCPEEQVVLTSSSYPASMMPTASDNCGMDGVTNSIPEGGLSTGESTVTFTAEDAYGNTADCVVSVMVEGEELISLHPASDIGATLAENENSQVVTWNPLNATTQCSYCEETSLEGFTFVGNYWGHQYFLADEVSLTRQDAQLIAEGYDAHLAVISTLGENNYLKEALSNEVRTAWIGLMPQNTNDTWSFVWDNDEANIFDALDLDLAEVNANTRIVLSQNGNWVAATNAEEKFFLIERPCVDFTQVGPYTSPTTENGSIQLLRSGDAWPEGEYEVTYAAVDMCGNESQLSFDVTVQPEVSEFCTTEGTDNSVWIEGVTFHEMTSTSSSNEGYADFSEEVTTMNIGDGVVLLDLTAGGNTTDEVLYWRVWLDRNNDGDFFDAGEVLFEQSTENAHLQANVALGQEAVSNARLRVAVARHSFPAPCGNPYIGEVEDYTVTLTIPAVIDIEKEPQVQIFPNPASTYVNVDLRDFAGEEVSIRIINNLGKSISFTKEIVAIKGSVRLDLKGMTEGMYNISISTNERQITKRLVVSNTRGVTATVK
jgi:hypothetical protein